MRAALQTALFFVLGTLASAVLKSVLAESLGSVADTWQESGEANQRWRACYDDAEFRRYPKDCARRIADPPPFWLAHWTRTWVSRVAWCGVPCPPLPSAWDVAVLGLWFAQSGGWQTLAWSVGSALVTGLAGKRVVRIVREVREESRRKRIAQ